MSVIELDVHSVPERSSEPVSITFIWNALPDLLGVGHVHTVRVLAPDGDFQAIIDLVRDRGGVYEADKSGDGAWFLPWPPAGIRIEPAS